ncbi:Predicted ATPase [Asanoa hainanensis]|uniref:Predicted ATPase n=1 Tax=Asanoa hainanensis TaxID=560556 RepID=A0A239P7F7_9ACTN|nr:AAA family ATPase [Asanoa hainanensis]SNT62990.1 Predicted ATPase [Asanoa hainanensis]
MFVSSAIDELAPERQAVRDAVLGLRLIPVMAESAARPHPRRDINRAYLRESHLFVGIYWQGFGEPPGVADEFELAADLPKLVYVKQPAPDRDPRLALLLERIKLDQRVSYRVFGTAGELRHMIRDDIALLLSERFAAPEPEPAQQVATVPAPASPILGRDAEIAQLRKLLTDPDVRLVTLTGPGGVGKTRLATELAGMLAGAYPDGVRFVELSTVTTPDLVGAALAQALGLHTTAGRPPIEDVEAYLRSRTLLLVIDNFEQVAEAAPVISRLLSAAPGVTALATSRAALRLTGEYTVEVPPLPLPDPNSDYSDARTGAVRLFVDRARAAKRDFTLTPENTQAVIEICRRLDGLPLAIELAAAKVRVLPPPALLGRLRKGVGTLSGGARDLPVRQRTLRNTIAWSHDLLTPDQQRLFCILGVFAGGFDLAAVEAICGPEEIELLDVLVESSLVKQEAGEGEPRFRMFDSIREYALEQLRDTGEWHDAHAKVAAYFVALAERLEPLLGSENSALQRLETEHDNVNASMNWLIDSREYGRAIQLSWMLWVFWWLHGHVEEGVRYLDQVVDEARDLSEHETARLLVGTGAMAFVGGDLERSEADLTRARALLLALGDHADVPAVSGLLGSIAMRHGHNARARELLEETRLLGERFGKEWVNSLYYSRMGNISLSEGDTDVAARIFEQGLEIAERSHDRLGAVVDLYSLAVTAITTGDVDGAEAYLREGITHSAEAGDRGSMAFWLDAMADICVRQGHPARAVRLTAAARTLRSASTAVWLRSFAPEWPSANGGMPAMRTELGEASFTAAWARGSTDDLGSAVRFALGLDSA